MEMEDIGYEERKYEERRKKLEKERKDNDK